MSSLLRSAVVFALVSAVAIVSMPGCSQQGEGERCDSAKTGNADCDSGLSCVPSAQLLGQTADRCCPAAGTESDSRCTRTNIVPTTGGSSSGGTSNGLGGAGSPSVSLGGMSGGDASVMASSGAPSTEAGAAATASGGVGGAG